MNNFEDHIKRKLNNHKSSVDTDALWNSISEDIPKEDERKKRGVFFFFFFGLGIAGGMIFIYLNPSYQNELATYFHYNTNTSSIAEDIHHEINMDFQHDDMMPSMFGHHISDNENDDKDESKLVTSNHIKSVQTSFIHTASLPILFLHKNEAEEKNNTTILQTKKEENPTIAIKEIAATLPHEWLAAIDLLDAEVFSMNDLEDIENISIDEYEEKEEEEEVTKEEKKVKMAIGFTTGYSSSISNFSADLLKSKYYARRRNKSEKHKSTMTLSGDFVLSFHHNMRFRTGVEYTRISESFRYYNDQNNVTSSQNRPADSSGDSSTSSAVNSTIDSNLNSSGENDNNTTTSSLSNNTRLLEFQSANQHHFIDIPLIVGYEAGKKRLSLLVEVGVSLNMRVASKGHILLLDGNHANLKNTEPIFNRNINVASYTGLSLNYDLSDRTQLKLGGNFKFNPFSITKKDYPIKQKYRSTGIHIGILHQL